MRSFLALVLGLVAGILGTALAFRIWLHVPTTRVEVGDILDVVDRFAQAAETLDRVCGPVPFHLEVRRDAIVADCGRPSPVPVVKIVKNP